MNEAQSQAEKGANQAELYANEVNKNWSGLAYKLFCEFARQVEKPFQCEDVRIYALDKIPEPPTNRAWGNIASRAKRNHIVNKVGIEATKGKTAHGANAAIWEFNERKPFVKYPLLSDNLEPEIGKKYITDNSDCVECIVWYVMNCKGCFLNFMGDECKNTMCTKQARKDKTMIILNKIQ